MEEDGTKYSREVGSQDGIVFKCSSIYIYVNVYISPSTLSMILK